MSSSVPPRFAPIVSKELASDERIEWCCVPAPRFFTSLSTVLFLFGLPVVSFMIFWISFAARPALESEEFDLFYLLIPLLGLPGLIPGLGLLSAPYWSYYMARHTIYVVTKRRVVTFVTVYSFPLKFPLRIRSFAPEDLNDISRNEAMDGSGDVLFAKRPYRDSEGAERWQVFGFYGIPDVRTVEDKLKRLAQQQPQSPTVDGDAPSDP